MNATDIEVHSGDAQFLLSFQYFEDNSPKRRSHEVERILAPRDRFRTTWRRGQCSAAPANSFEKTEKSIRSRMWRTLSRGQVADQKGFELQRRIS
ncbi:hypothetical protein OEZ49_22570 [Ruegeria sp. WL0004]|uniref:Uncharacterized protein n=1 Tax=Ruegeria marisflavi TaxID=2984152 RepID=A0ABT2WZW6_9RHOB|nr:hypothetical protein [Ruegeria sp. WL0004]MCU9840535.1 hypothetical protein [Ruegeria sp. WL0004]